MAEIEKTSVSVLSQMKDISVNNYEPRTITQGGRQYLVVPVVMMVEGVHSGSRGPLYYPATELVRNHGNWNGIPITISHPAEDGVYISASSPGVHIVGKVQNVTFETTKLKAEAWLDIQQMIAVSQETLDYIRRRRLLEVSIGAFLTQEDETGVWNSEEYIGIARNLVPDHLALLPGEQGACGWADGCGIRVNSKPTNKHIMEEKQTPEEILQRKQAAQDFIITNKQGLRTLIDAVRNTVDSLDSEAAYHYLVEVYEGEYIYKKEYKRIGNAPARPAVFLQQKYSLNENSAIILDGEPVEVIQKVEYLATNENQIVDKNLKTKEKKTMNTNEKCCQEKVDGLITNERTRFSENDRAWLEGLTAEQLSKLEPKMIANKEEKLSDDTVKTYLAEKPWAELEKVLPEGITAVVNADITRQQEQREADITAILANTKDIWTKETLGELTSNVLRNMALSYVKEEKTDFSANRSASASAQGQGAEKKGTLLPFGIESQEK